MYATFTCIIIIMYVYYVKKSYLTPAYSYSQSDSD